MTDPQTTLQQWVNESRSLVFFGGAGVSTESGIPDFRSTDGLYNQSYAYPPEAILSHSFFERHPEEFFRFYREKMLCLTARPNAAHKKLAELEKAHILSAVITQNIDGLHQMAGSKNVLELHGSIHRNTCLSCGRSFDAETILRSEGIPRCPCGGVIKPDVVLYEEQLDASVLEASIRALREADCVIVGGTSLAVYPAAGLLQYYAGSRLILINKSPTPYDDRADLLIQGPIGKILGKIQIKEAVL